MVDAEFQLHEFREFAFAVNSLCIATNRDLLGFISGLSALKRLDEVCNSLSYCRKRKEWLNRGSSKDTAALPSQ